MALPVARACMGLGVTKWSLWLLGWVIVLALLLWFLNLDFGFGLEEDG